MKILVEGYPFVPVETIAKNNKSIHVIDFLEKSFNDGLKKSELLSSFNSIIEESERPTFVLLSCNLRTAKRLGLDDKKDFKRKINYYNWAFSILPGDKRKIDVSVVGLKSAASKISKLFDEE